MLLVIGHRLLVIRRVRIVVDCARLESGYTARYQEFESLTLRIKQTPVKGVCFMRVATPLDLNVRII